VQKAQLKKRNFYLLKICCTASAKAALAEIEKFGNEISSRRYVITSSLFLEDNALCA
jgi:hypothetical protein